MKVQGMKMQDVTLSYQTKETTVSRLVSVVAIVECLQPFNGKNIR